MHIVKMAQTETQNLRSLSTFRTLTHMQKKWGTAKESLVLSIVYVLFAIFKAETFLNQLFA